MQACVCTQEGAAQRPAHALRLARCLAQRLKHVAGQVSRAEKGSSRPAVAVEDCEESPTWGQPGLREPSAMSVLHVRRQPCAALASKRSPQEAATPPCGRWAHRGVSRIN